MPQQQSTTSSSKSSPRRVSPRSPSSSPTASSKKKKVVGFHETIDIHEFPIVLGDHPDCSSGVPIQIDWVASETFTRNLDMYEYCRQGERRPAKHLAMISAEKRITILLQNGFDQEEIDQSAITAQGIRDQRRETNESSENKNFKASRSSGGLMTGVLAKTKRSFLNFASPSISSSPPPRRIIPAPSA